MRRGANSVTSAVPIGSTPPMPMPADPKNDPKAGKKQGTHAPPLFPRVSSLFSLCYLLLEKSSKCLIPLSDCPFVLKSPPCFSWSISLFSGLNPIFPLERNGRSTVGQRPPLVD